VVNAGGAQSVDERTLVRLDGRQSQDPDGAALSFTWTQTAGPPVTLSSPSVAQPTFTAPEVTVETGLTFQLVVSDGTLSSAPATVTITVRQVDQVATPVDLGNRTFTFADGVAFTPALANTGVRLSFGDFGGARTGPFTLEAAGNTATGTVTVASCILTVQTSTFAAATFPGLQPGSTVPLNPCEVNPNDRSLRVQNVNTGAISASAAPAASAAPTVLSPPVVARGGGGCAMHPGTGFDPTLVGSMGLILVFLAWKRMRKRLLH